jgi:hypothetical protein
MKLNHLLGIAMLALPLHLPAQQNSLGQRVIPQEPIPRMVDPSIDRDGEPFSYPARSTDQLTALYAASGAELTPEDTLYTGYGELLFYVGIERVPVAQRIRTLQDGYLPIFHYAMQHDGLDYQFSLFAASAGSGEKGENAINFVRVTVHNPERTLLRGFVTTAWRYQGPQTTNYPTGDDRFMRPMAAARLGDKQQPGESFRPDSVYGVVQDAFLRDGKAIYFFPTVPKPQLTPSYSDYYNRRSPVGGQALMQPTTPVAVAEYALDVPAGGERTLDFKVPLVPLDPDGPAFHAAAAAEYDASASRVISVWKSFFDRGLEITTPESKVNDTFRTSLVNDLESLNRVGSDYIQTINALQYHGFYLRDSADFVRMYDTSGYPDIATEVLDFFATRQQPDGNFVSQPGQYDGWGQALWAYGEHYRMTHDRAFAARVYPQVQRAVDWLQHAVAADPLHIMPATDVRDNEYIAGHLTGYNFLALNGLQAAELLAHDLGQKQDEQRFRLLEQELRANFMKVLDRVTVRTNGYIPPALDGDMEGTDWGNLLSVVPEQQLSPLDPRVTATLRKTQAQYEEGLITYRQPDQGTYLHHYLTIKNTLTELVRGEQEQAMREFYAELLHTSSTNGGWEYSIRPWGDRDFNGNLAPHGWFAAEYRNLLRNMMLREEGSTLHLLSAVSPAWIGTGKSLHVARARTYFGGYGFDLEMPSESRALLTLHPQFDAGFAPGKVVLHIPWFMRLVSVRVDGKVQPLRQLDTIEFGAGARSVDLTWVRNSLSPDMPASYDDAVSRYKQQYSARFQQILRGTDAAQPH